MFQSSGLFQYSDPSEELRLVVAVDPDLTAFYRSLLPKSVRFNKPRWPAHCTIVRTGKENPKNLEYWYKYGSDVVTFNYDPYIYEDNTYFWLNVWCDLFVDIRTELGLPAKSRWTLPPSGGHQCFHITIANKKGV